MRLFPSLAGLLTAAVIALPASAQEPNADTVLATVNGQDITLGHVIALVDRLPASYDAAPPQQLLEGVLEQLIGQTALGAGVDDQSRRVRLGLENERRALLATEGLAARAQLDEAALAAAVDARMAEVPVATQYRASHILVETEEEATAIIAELTGGADFAETAKAKSTGPSGPNGGDLGWFAAERMVPEFSQAVQNMEPGAVSETPVKTQFGYHVIKLFESRQEPTQSRDSIEEAMRAELLRDANAAAIEAAKAEAEITRPEIELDATLIRNSDLLSD